MLSITAQETSIEASSMETIHRMKEEQREMMKRLDLLLGEDGINTSNPILTRSLFTGKRRRSM
jgi:hypothetical protein